MKPIIVKMLFLLLLLVIIIYNPLSARLMTVIVAKIYNIDSGVFYRMIGAESSFRSLVYSSQGAIGLGQVKPETCQYILPGRCTGRLWCPLTNLMTAALYYKHLLRKYNGNHSLTLAAYNWGETNVDKRIKDFEIDKNKNYRELFSDIPETYSFIEKILREQR